MEAVDLPETLVPTNLHGFTAENITVSWHTDMTASGLSFIVQFSLV
jgi:hypothetical protein